LVQQPGSKDISDQATVYSQMFSKVCRDPMSVSSFSGVVGHEHLIALEQLLTRLSAGDQRILLLDWMDRALRSWLPPKLAEEYEETARYLSALPSLRDKDARKRFGSTVASLKLLVEEKLRLRAEPACGDLHVPGWNKYKQADQLVDCLVSIAKVLAEEDLSEDNELGACMLLSQLSLWCCEPPALEAEAFWQMGDILLRLGSTRTVDASGKE
jgi:hypothetical protein